MYGENTSLCCKRRIAEKDTRKVMKGREKDSRINTRQNSCNAAPCATAPQSRYCTYVVVRKRSANCENIIKCRTTELARSANRDIFLCIIRLSVWRRRGELQRTENLRLVIKRKGRIRKRIFIILSASKARRVLAIRTQFNVSGEEKGSLLFTEGHFPWPVVGEAEVFYSYFLPALVCIIAFAPSCKKSALTISYR